MVLELITIGFRVWGLGFRVQGLGFRVWGLGFRVQGLGFGVWGLGFRESHDPQVVEESGSSGIGDLGFKGLTWKLMESPRNPKPKPRRSMPRV